jgi:hypothetical protein
MLSPPSRLIQADPEVIMENEKGGRLQGIRSIRGTWKVVCYILEKLWLKK